MTMFRVVLSLAVMSACLASCVTAPLGDSGAGEGQDGSMSETGSETTGVENIRSENGENEMELDELVQGNNLFAYDLYTALSGEEGNLFYSPASISLALGMTFAGARGDTGQQMAEVMHYTLGGEDLHPAFNAWLQDLSARGAEAAGAEGERFRLHLVNALWGQEAHAFQQPFLDLLASHYGAGLRLVDFRTDPEAGREVINAWVEEQTEDRISDLLPQGVLNQLTRLVLTNAVYFNAAWQKPFDESMTMDDTFALLDGSEVPVQMMQQAADFRYADLDGWQALELPYQGGELSMLILLPDAGVFGEVETALTHDLVEEALTEMKVTNLALRLPVFTTSSSFDLSKTLRSMGMEDAFSMEADFSGMDGTRDLFISAVVHEAYVSVDEAGTEAAAATAVVMQLKAVMQPPVEVSVDRPFLFLIRDNPTGSILFMGRILDPGQPVH